MNNASQNTETKPESAAGTGLFGKSFANKETKEAEQKQPSTAFSNLGSAPKSNDKEEEKPKGGLFGSLVTPASSGSGSLFGNSAFGNANKEAEKKDDPLAAYSKQPEGAENTKPKGLFANSNSSFGSLFKNAGESSGGGSLFGGLTNKDGGKGIGEGGGLFSNLNK